MAQAILDLQRLRTSYYQHSLPWAWGFLRVAHLLWHESSALWTSSRTHDINTSCKAFSYQLSTDANIQPSACKANMEKWNHEVDQNIKHIKKRNLLIIYSKFHTLFSFVWSKMINYTYTTLSIDILMTTDKHTFNYLIVLNIIKTFKLIKVLVIMTKKWTLRRCLLIHFYISTWNALYLI